MNKRLVLALALLPLLLLFSCEKNATDGAQSFFPEKQVNTSVNLLLPQYSNLSLIQGWVYLTDGYRGIILYRTPGDEFVAFDRTCPVNTTQSCAYVTVDSSNIYFKCGQYSGSQFVKCCESHFDASTGSSISGPATRGLKQYYTRKDGNIVYISSVPFF